ncbi:TetR family transcriptional regulator [Mycobacterium mantenii]|uniref:TetR family transcriptional regulator n=1 Tax=Mycobacterium mantenii TaxID=560555 RepID=A0A1A2TJK7_MYCNT|nr:TetR family transcriptional regulator [Mycobacterium mantenii]OBH54212.1 TetR family transcriptional regulator [Mycobacterium mantenii]OBH75684.1 TetR family transcriptional regulator [Mycobacterium mantenii]OBH76626.1 TetR family transcriptional regulator [Mycobacterium mantenii]
MAQRWTRERRLEHTRGLLLDAAEELFARKGFSGSALEEIADAAGYTRGAIYAHFGGKEELFLAVIERNRQRFLDGFADVISSSHRLDELDLDELANRWKALMHKAGADQAALGHEFTLFLMRSPEARERLATQRLEMVHWLSEYLTEGVARLGGALRIPATTMARVLLATNEGVTLASQLDGEDLYRAWLEMIISSIEPADASTDQHADSPKTVKHSAPASAGSAKRRRAESPPR